MNNHPDFMEIATLAARNGHSDVGMQSIIAGETIAQFRSRLVRAGAAQNPDLGMSPSEIARYNLPAAINRSLSSRRGPLGGFEGVVSDELAKRFGEPGPHRLLVPIDVIRHHARRTLQTRADVVGTTTSGGYLVETSNVGFVELALARQIFGTFGVQVLEGLVGNVSVPVLKSAGSMTDLASETTQAANNGQTFGQVALTPHTEAAYFEASRLLLQQTSASVQEYLINGMLAAFRARLEYLAIRGSGIAGEPNGLVNISAVTKVNLGQALAFADLLTMQTATGDRLGPSGGYVAPQAVASLMAGRQKASGASTFLWEGSVYQGVVAGFPGVSTSNAPASTIAFGNWANALFASWGGPLTLEINPVTNFQAGIVGMRIMHSIDFALLDPTGFSVTTGVS